MLIYSAHDDSIPNEHLNATKIHDATNGNLVSTFNGDQYACFSPDGNYVLSFRGASHNVYIWELHTGKLLTILGKNKRHLLNMQDEYMRIICCACYSPDGNSVAFVTVDGLIEIWDVWSGKHLRSIDKHLDGDEWNPSEICYSPDGNLSFVLAVKRVLVRNYCTLIYVI
jgi:WD40 repeat protein